MDSKPNKMYIKRHLTCTYLSIYSLYRNVTVNQDYFIAIKFVFYNG